jgi:hypothetical protein
MSPTGDLLVTLIFLGEVSSRACSGAFMCCTGMAQRQGQHTLWGNKYHLRYNINNIYIYLYICLYCKTDSCMLHRHILQLPIFSFIKKRSLSYCSLVLLNLMHHWSSQRSLHNAPIFRLLLKVAVKGTHQCDFLNFCGPLGVQQIRSLL